MFPHHSLFSLLSALLAEAQPTNTRYSVVAIESLDFGFRQATASWFSVEPSIQGVAPLSPRPACEKVYMYMGNPGTSTFGALIEAMSIMYAITGNHDLGSRLQRAIESILYSLEDHIIVNPKFGVLPNKKVLWDPQGYNPGDDGDMYLLRGLAEAKRRAWGALSAEVQNNLTSLLGVHYNAIRDYAAPQGVNVYSRKWVGPRPTQTIFDLYNQAAAAQILIDGISLFNGSNDTPTSPEPPSSSLEPASSRPPTLVITGAAVGSVISLALIGLAISYAVRRWRRKHRRVPSSQSDLMTQVLVPFDTTTFRKTTAFPHKYPVPESPAGEVVSEARLAPLRRHNSAPSALHSEAEGVSASVERRGISEPLSSASNDDGQDPRPREHVQTDGNMEMEPTFPDMVRVIYQRLWAQNGLENPPEYRSEAGEPPQQP
ncbi:hypothetical protein PQX77_016303 [Marasmius sp. AFHP31]|nr:hypothetical protein PQX77_016303 [Marasmius sp. AFHP31]